MKQELTTQLTLNAKFAQWKALDAASYFEVMWPNSYQCKLCIGNVSHVSTKEATKGNRKPDKNNVRQICIDKGPTVIMLVLNSRVTHPQTFPLYMQLDVKFSALQIKYLLS